jgi:predicted ribosome quality control (RQC) complex YloA/Tae2 family protein
MEIEIDLNKSVEENAGIYFEKAKKLKKKLKGAGEALAESKKKLDKLMKEEEKFFEKEAKKEKKVDRKKEWYEKFHWFLSSEGFLCIGGKDATSNDIVVKKHTEKGDLVFHTDMAGSPFFIVKDGENAGGETYYEAAQATGINARAWKLGMNTIEVFYVKPDQVVKESGLKKGAFMIYGKTLYIHPKLEMAIGLLESGQIIGGPVEAIKSRTEKIILVVPGRFKKSDLAKQIKKKLKGGDLDEIIKFLPAGGGEIKRN